MANKLAGQRAKFSKARAKYYTADDESQRQRAAQLMAEVLIDAPSYDFSEVQVTQGADVPDEVRQLAEGDGLAARAPEVDDDQLVEELSETVDTTSAIEIGEGEEFVYAYGYPCAPDRLKIGSCTGDVIKRIADQIYTGTPDKPSLLLTVRTNDCRNLERLLHNIFRYRGRRVIGAGSEWFLATRDEVVAAYESIPSF